MALAALRLVFGIVGNLISTGLFLSPMPTFWRIYKQRSTQEFSWLPYAVTLLNCLLWTCYGLPWVKMNIPVLTINTTGALLQLLYVAVYFTFTSSKKRVKILPCLLATVAFLVVVIVVSVTVMQQRSTRKLFIGVLCVIFTTGMNIAPLSIMRMVVTTRSVQYMPFYLSLFVFINGCAWLVYGLLTKDVFIIIPNALGAFFGAMQLILYAVYYNATPKVMQSQEPGHQEKDSSSKAQVEMGNSKHSDMV